MADGDLVLIDAGAEYQTMQRISRTFPTNGKFSGEQRAIMTGIREPACCHLNLKPELHGQRLRM